MTTRSPKPPQSIIISYLTMRKVIGFLGVLLVPVLIVGSFLLDTPKEIKESVSAYYYSHMGNVLVGTLCGISLFLFSYHGNSRQDSITSKLAGFFALGIAFFPTSPTDDKTDISSVIHYVSAGIFFAMLSYMSLFLFTKIYGNNTLKKRKRNRVYKVCGMIMLVSVVCIPFDKIKAIDNRISFLKPVLVLETLALTSFGISWLTKGQFLLKDDE